MAQIIELEDIKGNRAKIALAIPVKDKRHIITLRRLTKYRIHERFSEQYNIPVDILKEVLIEFDTNWTLGDRRYAIESRKLKKYFGIDVPARKLRYINNIYKNYTQLYYKLKRGGFIISTLKKELYKNT